MKIDAWHITDDTSKITIQEIVHVRIGKSCKYATMQVLKSTLPRRNNTFVRSFRLYNYSETQRRIGMKEETMVLHTAKAFH
jgi:hypothetical protein